MSVCTRYNNIFIFVLFLVPGSNHCQVIFAPVLTDIYARDSLYSRQGSLKNSFKRTVSGCFEQFQSNIFHKTEKELIKKKNKETRKVCMEV